LYAYFLTIVDRLFESLILDISKESINFV